MRAPRRLDFLIAGGAREGLGHVMRSRALAEAALARGFRVRAYFEGDAAARERWTARPGLSDLVPWSAWCAEQAGPITILDHPFEKDAWLDRLAAAGSLALAIDDERVRARAPISILPGLHHAARPGEDPARVLAGPRYSILSKAHREVPFVPYSARHRLLLSMGGADPHHVTPRVAPLLVAAVEASTADHGLRSREVVLGPAFQDPSERIAVSLARAGWRVHRALPAPRLAQLMAHTRLAVVGFGTSLSELAFHGTPAASITHHTRDEVFAADLERRGFGQGLGCATDFDEARVAARLARLLEEPARLIEAARRAQAAIEDGRGLERILERIEASLQTGLDECRAEPPSTRGPTLHD